MTTAAPPRRQPRAPERSVEAPFAKRRRRVSPKRDARESFVLFAVAYAVYAVIGYRAVVVDRVVPFDSLARLAHAYFVWYNAPPKLAAVGFIWPPVSTLVFLPLAATRRRSGRHYASSPASGRSSPCTVFSQ